MYSVLYLAFTVLSVAGVFFTLEAEYLGAIQILVYGGGIVVLYIFVIIIVNLDEVVRERRKLFITAEMSAADAVVATCKATYITVDPSIFAGAPDPR